MTHDAGATLVFSAAGPYHKGRHDAIIAAQSKARACSNARALDSVPWSCGATKSNARHYHTGATVTHDLTP